MILQITFAYKPYKRRILLFLFLARQVESGKKLSKNLLKNDIDSINFRNFLKLFVRDSILFREKRQKTGPFLKQFFQGHSHLLY